MNYRLVGTLIVITNLFSHIDHEVPSCDRQRARCRKTWKLTFFAEKWLFTRFCHRSQTVGITKLVGCQANTRDYSKVISLSPQSKNACFGIHFQNPIDIDLYDHIRRPLHRSTIGLCLQQGPAAHLHIYGKAGNSISFHSYPSVSSSAPTERSRSKNVATSCAACWVLTS